jgi:hypothetical protein
MLAGPRFLVQCRLQPFFFITPGNGTHGLAGHAYIGGHLRHFLPIVKLAQNQSSPQ